MSEKIVLAINDQADIPDNASTTFLPYTDRKKTIAAFFIGSALITAFIYFGKSYALFISFLVFSLFMSFLWRKTSWPLIFLISITAATPIAVSKQQFACNIIFAIWFAAINFKFFFKLPQWIYLPIAMAMLGLITSSINWLTGDVVRNIMRQGTIMLNIYLAPFLLLPVVYVKMKESRDHVASLQGLLFFLIIPSTLILLLAKYLGTPINSWQASLHGESITDGFLMYKLGQVNVNYLRTEVGFIFAALVCASTGILVSKVKPLYRYLAGACFAINVYLIIGIGSFGSGFACICGMTAIFYALFRTGNLKRAFTSLAIIACLLPVLFFFLPQDVQHYLEERYKFRVVKSGTDQDRFMLWGLAVDQLLEHPEGVGFTLRVGERIKTFTHNDYLAYTVSYGIIGGLGYILLVVGLLVSFFQRLRRRFYDPYLFSIYLAGFGVLAAIAVNSMTDHMNSNRWYFNVIWSLIWYGYFCSQAPNLQREGSS